MYLDKTRVNDILSNTNPNDVLYVIQPDIIICHPSLLLNENHPKKHEHDLRKLLRELYVTKRTEHMKYVHIPNINLYPSKTVNTLNNDQSDFRRWAIVKITPNFELLHLSTAQYCFNVIGQFEIFNASLKKIPLTPYEPVPTQENQEHKYSQDTMFSLFIHQTESNKQIGTHLLTFIKNEGLKKLHIHKLSCLVNQENEPMNRLMNKVKYESKPAYKAFKRIKQKFNYYFIE